MCVVPTENLLARAVNTVVEMAGAPLKEVCAAQTAWELVPLDRFALRMANAKFLRGYQLEFHSRFCIWLSLHLWEWSLACRICIVDTRTT
jgi:hypothetical protein